MNKESKFGNTALTNKMDHFLRIMIIEMQVIQIKNGMGELKHKDILKIFDMLIIVLLILDIQDIVKV